MLNLIIYIPLQIVLLPLTIIGVVLVGYRQLVVSKKLGISQTAVEIINGRITMDAFGIRDDQPALGLAKQQANNSVFGLFLAMLPLWLATKITGRLSFYPRVPDAGKETIVDLVPARTLYFDDVINRVIPEVEQFVVMGAGYDTRAYGALKKLDLVIFEIDQPRVQEHKIQCLTKAAIAFDHVRYVPIDFSEDNLLDTLSEAGVDWGKKTLFLWEGVTLYLSEADVRKTISDLRSKVVAGSVLLADIYADSFLKLGKGAFKKTLEYTNEGFGFGLPFANAHEYALSEFVESTGLTVGQTHFLGSLSESGPFSVVVEMRY